MINLIVKNRIKDICYEKGMTLRDLCHETGISEDTIYRLQGANLKLENVARILLALNCKFEDVFEIIKLSEN